MSLNGDRLLDIARQWMQVHDAFPDCRFHLIRSSVVEIDIRKFEATLGNLINLALTPHGSTAVTAVFDDASFGSLAYVLTGTDSREAERNTLALADTAFMALRRFYSSKYPTKKSVPIVRGPGAALSLLGGLVRACSDSRPASEIIVSGQPRLWTSEGIEVTDTTIPIEIEFPDGATLTRQSEVEREWLFICRFSALLHVTSTVTPLFELMSAMFSELARAETEHKPLVEARGVASNGAIELPAENDRPRRCRVRVENEIVLVDAIPRHAPPLVAKWVNALAEIQGRIVPSSAIQTRDSENLREQMKTFLKGHPELKKLIRSRTGRNGGYFLDSSAWSSTIS